MDTLAPVRRPSADPPAVWPSLGQPGGYRLIRRLGEGGMGTVYLGFHAGHRRTAAVKILAEHLQSDKNYADRFLHEAATGRAVDHPNIVRTFDSGRDPVTGRYFMVMEHVDGANAQDLLAKHGPLPVAFVVRLGLDMAAALDHLHNLGMVHRDIKPDNILIGRDGVAKLADFGLVKHLNKPNELTVVPAGFGTTWYMPYEQARNASFVDGRSDIFALGVTLYHLLTGTVPFAGADHREVLAKKETGLFVSAGRLNDGVPPELDRVLSRMLARDPRRRYCNAAALVQALTMTGLAAATLDVNSLEPGGGEVLPSQATRPDLQAISPTPGTSPWFVRYHEPGGAWSQSRATEEQIIRGLKAGAWPADAEAARSEARGFRPIADYPEFAGVKPEVGPVARVRALGRKARGMILGAGFGMGLLAAALAASVWRAMAEGEPGSPLRAAVDSVLTLCRSIW